MLPAKVAASGREHGQVAGGRDGGRGDDNPLAAPLRIVHKGRRSEARFEMGGRPQSRLLRAGTFDPE